MLITLENTSFSYENGLRLTDLTLNIPRGKCFILCGESGCGKTTITRLLNGLIPELFPGESQGAVCVKQMPTATTPIYQLSAVVGSVFQNPKTQFFTIDVRSELAFACENLGMPKENILARMTEVVTLFEIDHLLERKMFDLSGGEKQLVAFASAYMIHPDVLVLDEPSSNLDFQAIEKIKRILTKVKEQGCTLVIAEHRLYYLQELADQFIVIADGEIQLNLTKDDFLALTERQRADLGLRTLQLDQLTSCPPVTLKTQTPHRLKLTDIHIRYPKASTDALHLTNISFHSGDVTGILGHNGAGKTTLAKSLAGLLKTKEGNFSLDQHSLDAKDRINLSYLVMQDVNYQLFCETVKKELLLKAGKPELFDAVIAAFDLQSLLERHPMSLSGGQKQRVAIATAILSGKQVIILDEPTSGLDYFHMRQVSEIIAFLRKQNVFIFIISHDLEFIQSTCTHILTLEEGRQTSYFPLNPERPCELFTVFNNLQQPSHIS